MAVYQYNYTLFFNILFFNVLEKSSKAMASEIILLLFSAEEEKSCE